jgi:protein MpaA
MSFVGYLVVFAPRTIHFSYEGNNCQPQLTILPRLLAADSKAPYDLMVEGVWSIAGYPIAGTQVCVVPVAAPKPGEVKVGFAPWNSVVARKTFIIRTPDAPKLSVASLGTSIPSSREVNLAMSGADTIFGYDLVAAERRVACQSSQQTLTCDVAKLALTQGEAYTLRVERHFDEHRETVAQKKVTMLEAVRVTTASIQAGQTVYDAPKEYILTTNKALVGATATLKRSGTEDNAPIMVDARTDGDKIIITPTKELARDASYSLDLTKVTAKDGSTLGEAYAIDFRLSGGPKVTGASIGSSGVESGSLMSLQFDQALGSGQDLAKYIRVSGGGAKSITSDGSRVLVRLNAMDRCSDFTISVDAGITSEHGIVSAYTWRLASRIRCSTVSTIGYSVQGRPIYAYYFGSGSTTVLFTGAIHGSELSSKYIMDGWVAHLEERAREIPSGRQVVVVPAVNPDGVASRSRYNARSINLNRNFATTNWVSDTPVSGGVEKGAGGASASSEPETTALVALTQRLQPRLVVTYHSQGSLINSNDVGIAASLGPRYASAVGYGFVASGDTAGTFGFEMTGTYEDWLAERSTPAILIELPNHTGQFFSKHASAMWMVVRE